MEAQNLRKIKDGKEYDKYFPRPNMKTAVIKKDADLDDTLHKIKSILQQSYSQTREIAKILKGKDVKDTLRNIWNFVYQHIQYRLDDDGTEQLRTPARTWADRQRGVDCDDYSIFISTILLNLGIPHSLRLAEYKSKGFFQHIYLIVPYNGQNIIIDCVKDAFDDEEEYTNYKDIKVEMELQHLTGFGNTPAKIELTKVGDLYKDNTGKFYKLENYGDDVNKIESYDQVNEKGERIENGDQLPAEYVKIVTPPPPKTKSWLERQMEWVKNNPTTVVVGGIIGLVGVAGVISMMNAPSTPPAQTSVSGLGKTNKKAKHKHKYK